MRVGKRGATHAARMPDRVGEVASGVCGPARCVPRVVPDVGRLAHQVSRARHIAASVLLVRGQVRHLPGELLDLLLQGQNTAMARRHRP